MSAEPNDDYFTAAAAVVEAARELEHRNDEFNSLQEASIDAHEKKRRAEKKLTAALENLKRADTGRSKG